MPVLDFLTSEVSGGSRVVYASPVPAECANDNDIYRWQQSCGEVMFSQVSVCPWEEEGELVCLVPCPSQE